MTRSPAATADAGAYQRWLAGSTLLVLPFVVVVLVMTAQFAGLKSQPAAEQAVVARRLVAGHGYSTSIVLPRSLAYHADLAQHAELRQAPLSVLPTAALFRALGEREGRTAAFSSMLAWLLTVWLTFLAGRRLFGLSAGWLAALLLTFGPTSLAFAISADGRTWAMPLLVALWLLLATDAPGLAKPAAIGLVIGLLTLCSLQLAVPLLCAVVPLLAWPPTRSTDAAAAKRSPEATMLAVVVMLVVLMPWLGRNLRVAGTPLPGLGQYTLLTGTPASPGRSIERRLVDPGASPLGFVRDHKRQLANKFLAGLRGVRDVAAQTIDGPVLGLFLAALLLPLAGAAGAARRALAVALVAHVVVLALFSREYRALAIWQPVLALYAAWFVTDALGRRFAEPTRCLWQTWSPAALRGAAICGLLLLVALPGLSAQVTGERNPLSPSAPNHKLLVHLAAENEVIVCDDPWTVAWETDRTCLWLPQGPEDFEAARKLSRPRVIYFSRRSAPGGDLFGADERGTWWSWAQAMPAGYLDYRPAESRIEGERILVAEPTGQP